MPRHAPKLECSAEDRASLVAVTKNCTAEARIVERARIVLACLEGKEIQRVARELRVSVPSVSIEDRIIRSQKTDLPNHVFAFVVFIVGHFIQQWLIFGRGAQASLV